ncbi:MAG TPA: hypothetical protein VN894_21575, partial [Polyangiaceae bacterium]|nr:hypothetical protein [Polyangiaceae bacterium]
MDEIRRTTDPQRPAQRLALAVLMGLAFVVVAWMSAPLLVGLALGTVMGFTAQPVHARLCARMGQRRTLAAAATTLLGGLTIAAGVALVFWIVGGQLGAAVALVQRGLSGGFETLLGPRTTRLLDSLGISRAVAAARLRDELGRLADLAARGAGLVVQASAGV